MAHHSRIFFTGQRMSKLLQAECKAIFPDRKLVEAQSEDGVKFYVNYDKLAICTGSQVWGFSRRVCTATLLQLCDNTCGRSSSCVARCLGSKDVVSRLAAPTAGESHFQS